MANKPKGRPRASDPTLPVSVRLTTTQYDATYAHARAERLTVSQWIRQTLQTAMDGRGPGVSVIKR